MLLVSLCLLVGLLTGQSNGCKLDTYEKDLFGAKKGDWKEPIETLHHLVDCHTLLIDEGNESRAKQISDLIMMSEINEDFCFKYEPEGTDDEGINSDDGNKIKISVPSDVYYFYGHYIHKQHSFCNEKFNSLAESFKKDIGYDLMAANTMIANKLVELTDGVFEDKNSILVKDPKEFSKPLSEAVASMAIKKFGSKIKGLEEYKSEIHKIVDSYCEKGLEKLKPILTYYRNESLDYATPELMDVMVPLSLCGTYDLLDVLEASFDKYNQLIQEAPKGRLSKILRSVTGGSSS